MSAAVARSRRATRRASERAAQRKREREATRLTIAVEGYEREVAGLEGEVAELEARFTATGYYERTPRERIEADARRQGELRGRLAEQLAAWERSAAELEALQPAS